MMFRIFPYIFLLFFISCSSDNRKYENSFDIPLLEKNDRFRNLGEYDSLVNLNKNYYRQAEEMSYEEGKALCYVNLARVNTTLENYQKAQILFENADAILKKSDNNLHKAVFNSNYARFNAELRRLDQALQNNAEAIKYLENDQKSAFARKLMAETYGYSSDYLNLKKRHKEAIFYLYKAKSIDHSRRINLFFGNHYTSFAELKLDSAEIYLRKIIEDPNPEAAMDVDALAANTILGEGYIQKKQFDKAEAVLNRALEIDKKTRHIYAQYTKYIYNDLKRLYEDKGDKDKAYYYLQLYADATDKTNSALLRTINQDMESFILEAKKDSERHERNIRWVILLSVAGLFLLGIYTWKMINILRTKKKNLRLESESLKNIMNNKKDEEIMELARNNDPEFLNQFKEAYPKFISNLLTINPNLEDSELAFCALLKMHFSSKEIAHYTLVQHRTVQQKKYRIRKKLNIPTETDTYHFFDDLT
ncbi:hypothetical protein [Chryseobacterium sp. BIGb0232]|uniref:tetratricopeptide repeat protein n=1 Tax=Chryseobacterium sp. BIGb0232 TaxID=2940598 RepID=UPI000FBC313B|nr:hypothetical protein [Chryseobacterium sp. BIGb0232]MCS4304190.1 tetratricopeptide (TPR) repeat protein [Chryseobacterium sp. BIGb0232]ROS17769.1 hypothetical protein EDF65_2150 [Chryseobacterium nakagawai]